jgi:hypothetical protein
MMWRMHLFLFVGLSALLGCAKGMPSAQDRSDATTEANPQFGARKEPARGAADGADGRHRKGLEAAAGAAAQPGKAEKPVPRKIVYTAHVELVVEDFGEAEEQVRDLLKEEGGYVAKSEIQGSPGSPRRGTWTVRVPVDHFDAFMKAVTRLGELRRSAVDSQDITDQFYDLAAHIKTDEAEEEGLRKLLEKAPNGKLEDLLALRRELKNIRGQIEEQKGRLQRWDKETQYATVNLSLLDRKDYKAPVAPDFGTSVGRTFQGSVDLLASFGRGVVLTLVALAPWLAVLAVLAVPAFLLWRRNRPVPRTAAGRPADVVVVEEAP